MTSHARLREVIAEYPYAGIDHSQTVASDHPQLRYTTLNRIDSKRAARHRADLERLARSWAGLADSAIETDFCAGTAKILSALECVSATSVAVSCGDKLFIERPGFEFPRSTRLELTNALVRIRENWVSANAEEKLLLATFSLFGLMNLPFETLNYQDLGEVPDVLSRLISRVECLGGESFDVAPRALSEFRAREKKATERAQAKLLVIPAGTRARVYIPQDLVRPDSESYLRLRSAIDSSKLSEREFFLQLLGILWREFADEGFAILHKGDELRAYALVSGCCFRYESRVTTDPHGKVKLIEGSAPEFLGTAGAFVDTPWRRKIDLIPFEAEDRNVRQIRARVLKLERLPAALRYLPAMLPPIRKAVGYLLHRQVNHNTTEVYHGRMQAVPHDQWAPNMSRGRHGRIINPPHAMGGVGEMFRGLLSYGDEASQFRAWRELDGSYGLDAMSKFLAYKELIEEFLRGED